MICSFCGANIPENEKTCPACGGAVPGEDGIPAPSPYYVSTVGEDKPAPRKKKAAAESVLPPEPVTPAPAVETPPEPLDPVEQLKEAVAMPEVTQMLNDRSNWAIASLVLGLIGLASFAIPCLCSLITSVPAVILGAMSLKSRQRKLGIAGMVLGIIEIVISLVLTVIAVATFFLAVRSGN